MIGGAMASRWGGLCLLAVTLALLAPQTPAYAACGPGFEATFIRQGGTGIWDSRGASMRNNVRDAVLPPFCFDPDGFPPHRHSTIAINAYPSAGQIVEIGWRKESTTGEPIYSGFWKYVVGGSEWDNGIFTTICCGWRRLRSSKCPQLTRGNFDTTTTTTASSRRILIRSKPSRFRTAWRRGRRAGGVDREQMPMIISLISNTPSAPGTAAGRTGKRTCGGRTASPTGAGTGSATRLTRS